MRGDLIDVRHGARVRPRLLGHACPHQVIEVRQLLEEAEVSQVHEAARVLLQDPERRHGYTSPTHTSLFLHADGYFARTCPAVLAKTIDQICRHWPGDPGRLGVRCIEYHTYRPGSRL